MNSFTLSKKQDKVFPEAITVEGDTFSIDADFRTVLKTLRMLNDDKIIGKQKPYLLSKWFYPDNVPTDPVNCFISFLGLTEDVDGEQDEPQQQQYDFEYDAEEIYISFMLDYKIDLVTVPFLHWNKFIMMLRNLSERTPFRQKIKLRFMDLTQYKGKAHSDMQRAQDSVRLPVRYTIDELREMAEFDEVWGQF